MIYRHTHPKSISQRLDVVVHGWRNPWLKRLPIDYLLRADLTNLSEEFDLIIDARSKLDGDQWFGGVTLQGREPQTEIIANRADGTVECWTQFPLPEVEGGWLERFDGIFSEDMASVDASILLGIQLASEQKVVPLD